MMHDFFEKKFSFLINSDSKYNFLPFHFEQVNHFKALHSKNEGDSKLILENIPVLPSVDGEVYGKQLSTYAYNWLQQSNYLN